MKQRRIINMSTPPSKSKLTINCWTKLPHDSNRQMHPYEKSTPQLCDQGYEPRVGTTNTHHSHSSVQNKICVTSAKRKMVQYQLANGSSIRITLSSNCSMKRSIPLIKAIKFSYIKTTPLGSPLVPLVYIIVQMS